MNNEPKKTAPKWKKIAKDGAIIAVLPLSKIPSIFLHLATLPGYSIKTATKDERLLWLYRQPYIRLIVDGKVMSVLPAVEVPRYFAELATFHGIDLEVAVMNERQAFITRLLNKHKEN